MLHRALVTAGSKRFLLQGRPTGLVTTANFQQRVLSLAAASSSSFATPLDTPTPTPPPPSTTFPSSRLPLPQQVDTNNAAWRTRQAIIQAGSNHLKLLHILGEATSSSSPSPATHTHIHTHHLDPHNRVILLTRLAQASQTHTKTKHDILTDTRFLRFVTPEGGALCVEGLSELQVESVKTALATLGVAM